ncbi:MAG: hypothetical protein LBI29_04665 [Rickettsiales bacterium]|jgi:cell shape-determining protein MreD|nr:hypothetical protein [Rickettsiales bacterium]
MARISSTLGNVEVRPLSRAKVYALIYSVFIVSTMFSGTPGPLASLARFFPDINLMLIFFVFFWLRGRTALISRNNLFFFGLIIDTVSFLPLGLSSLSLLASFKIMSKLRQYSIESESMLYFLENMALFMFLYMFIQWFTYSFYRNAFHPITYLVVAMFKNLFYSLLVYPLWKKYKNV